MIQIIIDSLIRASELSLLAVGLTMVYDVLRFPNFAQVEFGTAGAYLTLVLAASAGLGMIAGVIMAAIVVGLMGVLFDWLIFAKLRSQSPIVLMIASFGLGIAIRSMVRAIWGPSPRSFPLPLQAPMACAGRAHQWRRGGHYRRHHRLHAGLLRSAQSHHAGHRHACHRG